MAEFSQMAEIHPLRGRILPYLWQISHNGNDFVMAEICLLTHLLVIMHKLYDDLLIDFITLQKCFFMFPRIPQSTSLSSAVSTTSQIFGSFCLSAILGMLASPCCMSLDKSCKGYFLSPFCFGDFPIYNLFTFMLL